MIEFRSFEALLEAAHAYPPLPIAIVDATEEFVLEGALQAAEAGLISPVLLGNEQVIRNLVPEFPGAENFPIVHVKGDSTAAKEGVRLVKEGQVSGLMKGHLHTHEFLHPILKDLRGEGWVSHVFVAELSSYHKLLYITDAAVTISPGLAEKTIILQNAIDFVKLLGVEVPKVAVLTAIEVINPAIPSTIDAACLAKMADRGQISGALVDGPLAFDNAISAKAAQIKGIRSQVAGDVDILLTPDLVSGNILAKDLEYLANATLAGIVLGAQVPIVLTSRSDPPRARLVSAALASLMYHRNIPG